MKILLITSIAIGLFTLTCNAQSWTPASPNIYFSGGNVGIGTNIPAYGALTIGAPDKTVGSAIAIRQSNSLGYGFDFALDQLVNGKGYFYGVSGFNKTSLMEFDRTANTVSFMSGNVGIGTGNPVEKLTVNGNLSIIGNRFIGSSYATLSQQYSSAAAIFGYNSIADSANNVRMIIKNTNATVGADAIRMDYTQGISFHTLVGSVTGGTAFSSERMRITTSGNVGIGTTNPDQLLTVNGTIHSKAVVVDLSVVPDYVFKPSYKLRTLAYIKKYVDQNSHLPEVPSAVEIQKNGLNVGNMNTILLKKVEELTLYLIEKDKEIQLLQTRVKKLEKHKK